MSQRPVNQDGGPMENPRGTSAASPGGPPTAGSEQRRQSLMKATQVIWLVTSILEILIGIRVLLKLLGANPQAGFAQFVYGMTAVFLAPFAVLFPSPAASGSVLEISSLVAMLVYALLAWVIIRIMWVTLEEPPSGAGGPGAAP